MTDSFRPRARNFGGRPQFSLPTASAYSLNRPIRFRAADDASDSGFLPVAGALSGVQVADSPVAGRAKPLPGSTSSAACSVVLRHRPAVLRRTCSPIPVPLTRIIVWSCLTRDWHVPRDMSGIAPWCSTPLDVALTEGLILLFDMAAIMFRYGVPGFAF